MEYTNLKQIVEQLEKCDYRNAHSFLNKNIAFIALKKKANNNAMCCLGKTHICPLMVNDGYCCADSCQYKVREI